MWKKLFLIISLFCVLTTTSCQYFNPLGPIISIGVYWMEGEAHKYYNTDQTTTLNALRKTLTELDLAVTKEETKGNVVYLTAGDKERFHIKVAMIRPKTTKVSIRVKVFGDKPYAEMIYRHLDQKPGIIQYTSLEALNKAVE